MTIFLSVLPLITNISCYMYYIGHIIRVLCCPEGNIRLSNFTGPINEYIYRVYDIKKNPNAFHLFERWTTKPQKEL